MGLAERFRQQLDKQDIFSKKENITPTVTTPVETVSSIVAVTDKNSDKIIQSSNLDDLKEETINKIYNTPCWKEYTKLKQENMIQKYFDVKLKRPQYSNLNISSDEKTTFVKNIISLVNRTIEM